MHLVGDVGGTNTRLALFDGSGADPERPTLTQYYGSKELDASALSIPLAGLLPPDDERVIGTVEASERDLTRDGLVSTVVHGRD